MPSLRAQFGQFGQSGPMDLSLDECRENDLFTRKPSDLSRYTRMTLLSYDFIAMLLPNHAAIYKEN